MILNNTPIKTSNNFKANNIEIKDLVLPQSKSNFSNCSIYVKSEKEMLIVNDDSDIVFEDSNLLITKEIKSIFKLHYGVGEELLDNIKENLNQSIRIVAKENSNNITANIEFLFDENNKELIDNVEIYAEKNSNLDVVINYLVKTNDDKVLEDKDTNDYFHNCIINTCCLENSIVNLTCVNLLNSSSNNFINFENKLLDNATLNYTIVDFGGKNSVTNYYSNLFGKMSSNTLSTIYLGNKSQLFDMNYIAHCNGEKSNVDIEVQGALNDEAIKHFKGTIDFKKGCKKASGNENENCLLLSDKAKSLALPVLLCSEEDVVGNHSSSSGKASKQELFYLMSRGFSEKDAMKLLVRAKFNKIIELMPNQDVKDLVVSAIDCKL